MWIFVDDVAILKCARLGLVGIADQIDRPLFIRLNETPLQTARKTGAAAAAQSGVLDFIDNVATRHRQRLFQLFVAAGTQITIDIDCPIFASDVFKNQPMLQRMRRCVPRSGGL